MNAKGTDRAKRQQPLHHVGRGEWGENQQGSDLRLREKHKTEGKDILGTPRKGWKPLRELTPRRGGGGRKTWSG